MMFENTSRGGSQKMHHIVQSETPTFVYILKNLLIHLIDPNSQKWLEMTKKQKQHNPLKLRDYGTLEKLYITHRMFIANGNDFLTFFIFGVKLPGLKFLMLGG